MARIAVVAAHPDDEVIGVGSRLREWRDVDVVHITDGAPHDMADATRLGLATREEYAALRHRERDEALALAAIPSNRIHDLGRVDREASRDLVSLAAELTVLLASLRPDAIVTHPYEGGHPDHDAASFAVQAALRLLARQGRLDATLVEMSSYHRRHGPVGICTGCFLDVKTGRCMEKSGWHVDDVSTKRAMLDAYASQKEALQQFDIACEPLRVAPLYNYSRAPQEGPLYYETLGWNVSGHEWRAAARDAAGQLGLGEMVA